MKLEKITDVKDILTINPISNKKINRGYRCEIAYRSYITKTSINYKLDNKINTKFGDVRKGNYIYQVKAKNCEIKLVKEIKDNATDFEEVLTTYVKYNKANRYVYIIEYNNNTYAITMTKTEFIEFVKQFGRYSKKRNNIRIKRSDNIIYQWAKVAI